MSEMSSKYKQILNELEKGIKDPNDLEFAKGKFSELSMLFMEMLDKVTSLTEIKIKEVESKQEALIDRVNSVQSAVDEIESDIYEDDEDYEFEIVCPYCDFQFTTDIEYEDNNSEIECPKCHNSIELDFNSDSDMGGCQGHCSHCESGCVAEDEEEYHKDENNEEDM